MDFGLELEVLELRSLDWTDVEEMRPRSFADNRPIEDLDRGGMFARSPTIEIAAVEQGNPVRRPPHIQAGTSNKQRRDRASEKVEAQS